METLNEAPESLKASFLPKDPKRGKTTMYLTSPAEIFGIDGVIVLVVVVVVLFGSTQIPKLARSLGSAQKEFKKGIEEGADEARTGTKGILQTAPGADVKTPAKTTVLVGSTAPGSHETAS